MVVDFWKKTESAPEKDGVSRPSHPLSNVERQRTYKLDHNHSTVQTFSTHTVL